MANEFNVAVKLHADASQYTAEFMRAGQVAQAFTAALQGSGTQAAMALVATSGAAQTLSTALQATGTQGAQGLQKVTQASRDVTASQAQVESTGKQLLSVLREQIAVSGKSADELLRYRAAQAGVAAEAAPLILQWQNQKAAQLAAAEAARLEESAQREAMGAKQQAASAQAAFIAGLRDQAAIQGMSSTEVMRYRAAQLGVSESSAQYIRALETGANANSKGAISAGQHAQAMRMLPMQMTDVVTSVASGMPIWMVAIQQGGQIKDSFGGVGNAARALIGAINPVTVGIGLLAGAAGLAAAAYYQGSTETDRYREAIVMSGQAAGVSVQQLSNMARQVDAITGTQAQAAAGLTLMAQSGKIASDSMVEFTAMAVKMEDTTGKAVAATVKELEELGKKPAEASAKLQEQYNYLTPAVYRQIQALETQGRTEEAAALA